MDIHWYRVRAMRIQDREIAAVAGDAVTRNATCCSRSAPVVIAVSGIAAICAVSEPDSSNCERQAGVSGHRCWEEKSPPAPAGIYRQRESGSVMHQG
jgi:hypothetical protein